MQSFDEMPIEELVVLYYEKHFALRNGDMEALRKLKNKCPELFHKEKDAEIREFIEYALKFRESDRYKELCQLELKEKLTVISNDSSKKN